MTQEVGRRLVNGVWVTDVRDESSGGNGGPQTVWTVNVPLTNDEIKGLPTLADYKEIIATPGANKMILLLSAVIVIDAAGGAYTNITPGNSVFTSALALTYGDDLAYASTFVQGSTLLGVAQKAVSFVTAYQETDMLAGDIGGDTGQIRSPNAVQSTDLVDRPLKLVSYNGDGDYQDGDANNSGVVTAFYVVLDI